MIEQTTVDVEQTWKNTTASGRRTLWSAFNCENDTNVLF